MKGVACEMNYKFSEKVSGLQASAIREILKFTSDPEVISFAAGNPAPERSRRKKSDAYRQKYSRTIRYWLYNIIFQRVILLSESF